MQTTFRAPSAAAPRRSAWRLSRFRSRQANWTTGSTPRSARRCAAATAERCGCAALLSVQFTASTDPRSLSASSVTDTGSAPSVVWSSEVTTNSPARSSASRLLRGWIGGIFPSAVTRTSLLQVDHVGRLAREVNDVAGFRPRGRHVLIAMRQEVLPRRRAAEPPVDRPVDVLHVLAPDGHLARPLPRLDPDARSVGIDLAVPVLEHAAARTVPEVLRTPHRTGHPRRVQDALPAHAAVEDRLLAGALDQQQRLTEPLRLGSHLRGSAFLHVASHRPRLTSARPRAPPCADPRTAGRPSLPRASRPRTRCRPSCRARPVRSAPTRSRCSSRASATRRHR